ncbi:acyltransferase [Bifidobacterium sp. ESL0763]|uniref:acyltransferase family protein n=1 Tax=Bifidobacterium sp. ESL0763 TaxID=2983227 RepID=UPI0023F71B6D|nr:acyltransferase [Bifidobacterium sp. ESL0763]MDF7663235.1 acyltransferase [Bifidobacterium sp. ESL0763]
MQTATRDGEATQIESHAHRHKPRLFYLDWVRAISVLLVIVAHFNVPALLTHPIFANYPFHIFLGDLGVSQFLIISGAALMYTYGDEEHLDLKTFYWKRFKSIFPMFWLAFLFANTFIYIKNGGEPTVNAPLWTIVLSFFGIDSYAAAAGFLTFATTGEWFIGFIVIFYVLFPLLRYGVNKHPVLTAAIVIALYVATIALKPSFHTLPLELMPTSRLPELLFGMYFIKYISKSNLLMAIGSVIFLILQQIFGFIPDTLLTISLVGIAFFLVLARLANIVEFQPIKVVIGTISKYSYAIFLTHHVVIEQIFTVIKTSKYAQYAAGAYVLFAADCVVIFVLSLLLYEADGKMKQYVEKMFVKPEIALAKSGTKQN